MYNSLFPTIPGTISNVLPRLTEDLISHTVITGGSCWNQ